MLLSLVMTQYASTPFQVEICSINEEGSGIGERIEEVDELDKLMQANVFDGMEQEDGEKSSEVSDDD